MLKRFFAVSQPGVRASIALLLLRVVVGAAFVHHGWGKIHAPFNWMGPEAPTPGILQALAALSEFGGGIAWVLGGLTRLAAFGILSTMCVAVATHLSMGDPFISQGAGHSYELAAAYLAVALTLLTLGPGSLSADRFLFGVAKSR